jgi:hypothetical protein
MMAARMSRRSGARHTFPCSERSYRAIAWLAFSTHEPPASGHSAEEAYCAAVSGILDRLQAP